MIDTFTLDCRREQKNEQYPTSVPEKSTLKACMTMPISDVSECSSNNEFQYPLNEGVSRIMETPKPVCQRKNTPANNTTENSQEMLETGDYGESESGKKDGVDELLTNLFDSSDYELLDPIYLIPEHHKIITNFTIIPTCM